MTYATLNEHTSIGSYSQLVSDTAYQAGIEAAKTGAVRRSPSHITVNDRPVALTGFTRTDWFSGFDYATAELAQAELEIELEQQAEAVITQSIIADLTQAGFDGAMVDTRHEFGRTHYRAWCNRQQTPIATSTELDVLQARVRGWISGEKFLKDLRQQALSRFSA
jgi:hypothetical protein